MKLRYYLRGLGIGILISAAFFISSGGKQTTMTDSQIRARAEELGMIQNPVLTDLVEITTTTAEETEESLEETTSPEETTESEPEPDTTQESTTEENEPEETIEAESTAAEVEPENVTVAEATTVTIGVNRGEGSDTVSRRLYEAGLIADAVEFDRFLMANGYDKRIAAGEHEIPTDATPEEIADLLCRRG